MSHIPGSISRKNPIQRLLSIAVLVAMLGLLSATPGVKAQGGCPYPYDKCETIILRSTNVELKEEGGNVRGYTQTQFVNQGTGVIETSLDVNSADLLSYQLGGSHISIRNLDTNQLVHTGWGDKESFEYCEWRVSCSRVYNHFNISANARYQAELAVDYGVLVLPIKDFRLLAKISDTALDIDITLDSANVTLYEEGPNVRGVARVRFTPSADGKIDWSLNATKPNNIPNWISAVNFLVKDLFISVLNAWNVAEENLVYQLGGSKLSIKNLNTGELVLPPQEFCSNRLPIPGVDECNGKSNQIDVLEGVTYEAELWVDYGVLIGLIKDHVLTAEFHEMVEVDPPDETCQNPFPIDNLPYSGNLEFSGDHDWQKIKSPVKGTMVLTLDVPPDKDYQLEVWNDACSAVWVLSQNGTGVDEQFVMPVDPVYYRVHVFGKTPADFGAWYSVSALWDLDDNQWENAAFFDTPFQGNLEYSGDQDWQKITVPAGGTTLVLDVPEGKNYELELWRDDVKTKLAESKNGVGMDEFIPITQPGTYRIHIYGVNPATDFNASYGVSLIIDNIAPVTTIALSGIMGNNGWYRSNVQVALNATDSPGGSGVQKTEYGFNYTPEIPFSGPWNIYTGPFAVSTEGSTHLVYRSTDNAGNVEANKTQLIKIDKTPPTINIITPQAKDYLHSASFDIVWSASDSFSGVETSSAMLDSQPVANGQTIDLYALSLGPHTVTLQANDKAGNSASMSVIFNVTADINSLLAVTQHAYDLGWIEKQGVYNSLNASLKAAQASIERIQLNAARNQLMALLNKLDAQKGKAINQQAYDLLKADIMYLLEHLSQP